MERPVNPERKKQALNKLEFLDVSDSKKVKIKNLIEKSFYSGVYIDYFLSENPREFKDNLEHNKLFIKEAGKYKIKHDISSIVDDTGIRINFDFLQNSDYFLKKSINYTKEFCKVALNLEEVVSDELSFCCDSLCFRLHSFSRRIMIQDHYNNEFSIKKDSKPEEYLINQIISPNIREYWRELLVNVKEKEFIKTALKLSSEIKNECLANFSREFYKKFDRYNLLFRTFKRKKLSLEDIKEIYKTDNPEVIKNTLEEGCEKIREVYKNYTNGWYGPIKNLEYNFRTLRKLDEELERLEIHLDEMRDFTFSKYSEKLKNLENASYFLKVEELLPLDINFGNDGGCCIAVNDFPNILGNGTYVPFYMLDKGTILIGIYQKSNYRLPKRVGIILAFSTIDLNNEGVLLCNSVELSQTMNPLNYKELRKLMLHTTNYLHKFARTKGFYRVAMGAHNYNTAEEYLPGNMFVTPDYKNEELLKLPITQNKFYSEVIAEYGNSISDSWAWLKQPKSFL